jgi:hypothetical protein
VARDSSAEELAREFFAAMQRQPACAGSGSSKCIELVVYPQVCEDLAVAAMESKEGSRHLSGELCPKAPKYFRIEIRGVAHSIQHYFIPDPQQNVVQLRCWTALLDLFDGALRAASEVRRHEHAVHCVGLGVLEGDAPVSGTHSPLL